MRACFTLVTLLTFVPVCWADCEPSGVNELIEAKPVIKVAPIYPKRAVRKGVEGCVTLGYGLAERDPQKPGGLIATNIMVLWTFGYFNQSFTINSSFSPLDLFLLG